MRVAVIQCKCVTVYNQVLFADLHGHSRRKNVFLYGCSAKSGPQNMRERVFPKMLSRTCDFFSFE